MSKVKQLFLLCILVIFSIISISPISFASVKVTDENLKSALQKIADTAKAQINVANNKITITSSEGVTSTINYDLTNKPTFWCEFEAKQGMNYDEFEEKSSEGLSTMLGYAAVANVEGTEIEDAMTYFGLCLIGGAMSNGKETKYVVYDDTAGEEAPTSNGVKAIKKSEFGNYVMEYVNALYEAKSTFNDSEYLNTFELSSEKKDTTDTSCKIVTTLTVNVDADFTKIKELIKENKSTGDGNGASENNGSENAWTSNGAQSNNLSSSNNSTNVKKTSNTKSLPKTDLPKAGNKDAIILIATIIVFVALAIILALKNKDYKDVK